MTSGGGPGPGDPADGAECPGVMPHDDDWDRPATDGGIIPEAEAKLSVALKGTTPSDVVEFWRVEGALVHEPTGIVALDAATDGGPVYGTRWAFIGAPDACKTALLVQIGHEYAERGIWVGFLAVDEEAGDLLTRFAQRAGFTRRDCEEREGDVLQRMHAKLSTLPVRFYGPEHTIETAAADLHKLASEATPTGDRVRCALFADSIQTVRCDAARKIELTSREPSPRLIVTENAAAMRGIASRHRMIAAYTSEMSRAAYRNRDANENTSDMAAGKESGAIEYSARVMLSLRSVKNEGDLVEVSIVKNKHGRSAPALDPIYLTIDRRRMRLTDAKAPEVVDHQEANAERGKAKALADAALVAVMLSASPGLGTNKLRAAMKAAEGAFAHSRTDVAVAALRPAVVEGKAARGAKPLYLDGSLLPPGVEKLIPLDKRPAVLRSRPPSLARVEDVSASADACEATS